MINDIFNDYICIIEFIFLFLFLIVKFSIVSFSVVLLVVLICIWVRFLMEGMVIK